MPRCTYLYPNSCTSHFNLYRKLYLYQCSLNGTHTFAHCTLECTYTYNQAVPIPCTLYLESPTPKLLHIPVYWRALVPAVVFRTASLQTLHILLMPEETFLQKCTLCFSAPSHNQTVKHFCIFLHIFMILYDQKNLHILDIS